MHSNNHKKTFAAVAAALIASIAAMATRGAIVWDATESGRLMTATGETVVAKGVAPGGIRIAKCWFNKARRVRADGSRAMSQGEGTVCHVRRSDDGDAMEVQCQLFDCGFTKCVKLRLSRSGDDTTGRILYARYCTRKNANVVGADFDKLDSAGECRFRVRVEGAKSSDAAFEMKMPADVARYMEGFGRNGGAFGEEAVTHAWKPELNRDAVWLGRVNGGLLVRFKGANYRRPLVNAYYAWRKLAMPESWSAGGGTVTVSKSGAAATVRAFASGAPEGAEWNFDLYITPFHTLDMKTHLGDRYRHLGQRSAAFDAGKIRASGATVVNIHHNTLWNPYIDLYPYFDLLWRGEGFYNDTPPDFWLIERSSVAFGIPGEMLGRGDPFKGLLFGMTDRDGWGGAPAGLWRFFDEAGLGDMELSGWWDDDCPVKLSGDGSGDMKASVWKGDGRAVLVVANFSKKPRSAEFSFDGAKLGFDGAKAAWTRPAIAGVQKAAPAPDFSKPVEVPAGGGFVLVAP